MEVREPEVEEHHVRQLPLGERERLGAGRRLERPEPGRAQDVAREPQVPLVVVDDENERGTCSPPPLEPEGSRPYSPRMPIRIVLAEDHYLVREGVRRLLDTQEDLEVAAVCGDLDALLAAVEAERPDVVVTDIRMPPTEHRRGDPGGRAAARDEPGRRRRRPQPVREPRLRPRAPRAAAAHAGAIS